MAERAIDVAVVLLAGGEATRLPGKLALAAAGVPLLVHVYRNVARGRPVRLSCARPLRPELAAQIDAPVVLDRWPGRGPLAGLLSAMAELSAPWVAAVAGDAPFVDAAFIDALAAARRPGDEAVVPRHLGADGVRIEPLAALYDRAAFVRVGLPLFADGVGALHAVIDRLRARFVDVDDAQRFTNVNTPADYAALREALA